MEGNDPMDLNFGSGSDDDWRLADPGPPNLRMPIPLWDRIKFLIVLLLIFAVLVMFHASNNPLQPLLSVAGGVMSSSWWLVLLFVIELLRQGHYLLSEHSETWNVYWSEEVFGTFSKLGSRWNDWTRYRVGRALKVLIGLVILAIVMGDFYHVSPFTSLFQVPAAIFSALPTIIQIALTFFILIFQFVGLFWFLSRGGIDVYFPGDVKTRFSDVWGQDAVLERVKENIIFLKNPEAIEEKGGYVPGGILLWGPPGTGKTLMAEAVAGETENPFVFVDPGAFINMFFGIGILKVKALFRKLRKLAVRYGGVVVFFDEADSLGSRGAISAPGAFGMTGRSSPASAFTQGCNGFSYLSQSTSSFLLRSSLLADNADEKSRGKVYQVLANVGGFGGGGMGTLQALLTELSGLKKPRGFFNRVVRKSLGMQPKEPPKYRILVMMATNMPEALDEALLRPGRIDRIYKVGYPSKAGRIRTYEGYLSKVAHTLTGAEIDRLATITPYATGATIKDLVNEALINTIRDGREVVTWKDVIRAKQLKDLGPPEDVEYIERERHAVAIHEACHAVSAAKIRHHLTIDMATIEKGGNYLGLVASIPPEDQFTRWRSEYEADIMVSLASLVGERMFFGGDNSSGVSGDLDSATQLAIFMEGYWGMGGTLSSYGAASKLGIGLSSQPGAKGSSEHKKGTAPAMLGDRVESKLDELYKRVRDLLEDSRSSVLSVAHALERNKTLTGEDVMAIIRHTQGPLIDGRIYSSPEFLEELERYHEVVAAAHSAHQAVDALLPIETATDDSTATVGLNRDDLI